MCVKRTWAGVGPDDDDRRGESLPNKSGDRSTVGLQNMPGIGRAQIVDEQVRRGGGQGGCRIKGLQTSGQIGRIGWRASTFHLKLGLA